MGGDDVNHIVYLQQGSQANILDITKLQLLQILSCQPCSISIITPSRAIPWTSQVALVVKDLAANAGDIRDMHSIPRLGRCPGGGHGNPFQYSCLENPVDRGACWVIVHRVMQSQIRLKWLSMHIAIPWETRHMGRDAENLNIKDSVQWWF